MEELLNKLFNKLEESKMYSPVYAYEVKMTNQIIRSFFEEELSKLHQPAVSNSFCDLYKKQCIGHLCSVTPFSQGCEHLKQNER